MEEDGLPWWYSICTAFNDCEICPCNENGIKQCEIERVEKIE